MARCPFSNWRGTVPNESGPGTEIAHKGLVLHVEEGTEWGTDSWFHNPNAQVSAHFGVSKTGVIDQWVDTDDKAWAEVAGNPYWVSVETEGFDTEAFTSPQVSALGRLFAWLRQIYPAIPLVSTDDPNGGGLGWHGMGGAAWGGHIGCPGDLRKAARPQILQIAATLGAIRPMFDPPQILRPVVASMTWPHGGVILLGDDGSVYTYEGAPFQGTPAGKTFWGNRKAARIRYRPPNSPGAPPGGAEGYTITATTGEEYNSPF